MRILVVNDDGPPSDVSPYFLPFVTALQSNGHETCVVIPDKPSSWIGKAHAFNKSLTANRVCPFTYSRGQPSSESGQHDCGKHGWFVLDGSPASCVQIGLVIANGSIDLVISGPNHGRNASTIYNLSSGTVGGALEGALCGKRAISLSFGSKDPQTEVTITSACARSITLIEWLYANWDSKVEVYNINVPMIESVAKAAAGFTIPARTYWSKASLFTEQAEEGDTSQRRFQWSPDLSDIQQAARESNEGEDLWASQNGLISVTGLQANLAVAGQTSGAVGPEVRNV